MKRILRIGMDVHSTNYTLCAMEPIIGKNDRIFPTIDVAPDYKNILLFIEKKLLPVEVAMEGNHSEIGLPRCSANPKIAEYLGAMCAGYGTKNIRNEDGTLSCKW